MCGRFTLTYPDLDAVADALSAEVAPGCSRAQRAVGYTDGDEQRYRPRYNAAPSDRVWIVCRAREPGVVNPSDRVAGEAKGRLLEATWGFPVSEQPDEPLVGLGAVNARSETAHQRPAFREAFATGRCAVPVDGFYEWTGPRSDRRPLWIHRPDRTVFLLAAIFRDVVEPETGEVTRRFAILTTDANALVAPHHDRMPVVLASSGLERWLEPSQHRGKAAREQVEDLLVPAPEGWLQLDPVSKRVNDPHHDDPSCLEPLEDAQQTLF